MRIALAAAVIATQLPVVAVLAVAAVAAIGLVACASWS